MRRRVTWLKSRRRLRARSGCSGGNGRRGERQRAGGSVLRGKQVLDVDPQGPGERGERPDRAALPAVLDLGHVALGDAGLPGQAANRQATEEAAHAIAMRFPSDRTSSDPLTQKAIADALQLVLTEGPQARNTDTKLYAVHRADDYLNMLVLDRQAGKAVSDQQIASARDAFGLARRDLMQAVGSELDFEISRLSFMQREKSDGRVVAANNIGERYMDDRGTKMWATVMGILEGLEPGSTQTGDLQGCNGGLQNCNGVLQNCKPVFSFS